MGKMTSVDRFCVDLIQSQSHITSQYLNPTGGQLLGCVIHPFVLTGGKVELCRRVLCRPYAVTVTSSDNIEQTHYIDHHLKKI